MELSAAERIFEALQSVGAEYLVVGGLAVNAHGYVRMTVDIDVVIGLEPDNIAKALKALSAAGYEPAVPITPEQFVDPANRSRWQVEKDMRVLKLWSDAHPSTPLDVFVSEPFDFASEYANAVRVELREDLTVTVVRLETLLAMKREAGRPQDLADIAALEGIVDREGNR
jgi:hypothetical protein